MREYGMNKIKEGFDYTIMGHFHKPQKILVEKEGKEAYFITLGDWIANNSYGVYINGIFDLKYRQAGPEGKMNQPVNK